MRSNPKTRQAPPNLVCRTVLLTHRARFRSNSAASGLVPADLLQHNREAPATPMCLDSRLTERFGRMTVLNQSLAEWNAYVHARSDCRGITSARSNPARAFESGKATRKLFRTLCCEPVPRCGGWEIAAAGR